ncbi:penicillin-insensitive murein endopeptidase [Chelatococcus reniformis]|uniref:Penicillin-insensitive murein endopeptidase n=1 Tax=Chelatococcus reniformis TaxID=1494448 RepID=A0A916UPY3_9HYPH|nr:penicillin-insensitive murein endopeptidase [Chelatococcus reniformis]GGC80976.1 penicillin-insensitive murein endopeptidase [Chelatococcus reniformis]
MYPLLTLLILLLCAVPAAAQENARQEAARRAHAIASLPPDAARRLFGQVKTGSHGPAEPVGFYSRGCFSGGVQMPQDGDTWQVMRLSRNRAWGTPRLIAFLQRLSAKSAAATGWPGLLIGDMSQPRGGPMLTGHASHQLGIEADIWLKPMPNRRYRASDREEVSSDNLVRPDRLDIDPSVYSPAHVALLKTAASEPQVTRIFVNAAIKKALCRDAGGNRSWLRKIRPMWGHNYHFHVRLACPAGEKTCRDQEPPPQGDGCGKELDWWFTPQVLNPKPGRPGRPLTLADLPPACTQILRAP